MMVKIDRHLKSLLLIEKTTLKKGVLVTSITLLKAYYLLSQRFHQELSYEYFHICKKVSVHRNSLEHHLYNSKKKKKAQKLKILLNCYKYKMKYYTAFTKCNSAKD